MLLKATICRNTKKIIQPSSYARKKICTLEIKLWVDIFFDLERWSEQKGEANAFTASVISVNFHSWQPGAVLGVTLVLITSFQAGKEQTFLSSTTQMQNLLHTATVENCFMYGTLKLLYLLLCCHKSDKGNTKHMHDEHFALCNLHARGNW